MVPDKSSYSVKLSSRKKSISITSSPLKLTPHKVKISRFGRKSCFTNYSIQMEAPNPLDIFKAQNMIIGSGIDDISKEISHNLKKIEAKKSQKSQLSN